MLDVVNNKIENEDCVVFINKETNEAKIGYVLEVDNEQIKLIIKESENRKEVFINLNKFHVIKTSSKYFITTIYLDEKMELQGTRCFGYVDKYEEACQILNKNISDLHECLYNYAIVEKMPVGLNPVCWKKDRKFFKYDYEKRGFFEIEDIKELSSYCNFSIG